MTDQLFEIQKFTVNELDLIAAKPNEPHTHDCEELMVGRYGQGKMHRAKPTVKEGKLDLWLILFSSEFIPETTFQLYSYYHDHATIEFPQGTCFDRLDQLCAMMYEENQQPAPDYAVIRHLLGALFTMIESQRKKFEPEQLNQKTQNITFKNFLKILEENFRRPEGVDFYADKLFMSSRNLNLICQNILQQSVSEIIEMRKPILLPYLKGNPDKLRQNFGKK
ncbi:MAG TPA: hypothetical protein VIK10_02770 [Prolixibacteraceae bacterium]